MQCKPFCVRLTKGYTLQQSRNSKKERVCKEFNETTHPNYIHALLVDDLQYIISGLPNRLFHDKLWGELWRVDHVPAILHEQFE